MPCFRPLFYDKDRSGLINGIIVNWKSAQKPVDDNLTSQDLARAGQAITIEMNQFDWLCLKGHAGVDRCALLSLRFDQEFPIN